jgi:fermentation-respiration switch protein FrsA (DUF1100 family)
LHHKSSKTINMKSKIFLVALIATLTAGLKLSAQTASPSFSSKNFTAVSFNNGNLKMAGHLYLPASFDKNKKYPAIITVHPAGGVKEQTSGLYAHKLAEQGYITLAFDASHQGESEGLPRLLEDPTQRVEDIRSAVDYLTTLSYVNADRIGLLGICAGGGYSLSASQTDHRIKAVAVASAVDMGLTVRKGWDGNLSVSEQIKFLETVAKQRTAEANGAQPTYANYVPEAVDGNTIPDMREAHDYYRTPRAQHPNSTNRFLYTSYDKIMAFDAFSQLGTLLTQPALFIVGTKAGSRWQGELAHKLTNSPKELFYIDGATHMDLYDGKQYVPQVVTKLKEFYGKNL